MQRAFLIGVFLLALVAPPLHADCPMFAKLATVENVSGRTPISLDETKLLESLSQQGKIFAAPDFWSYLEKNQAKFEARLRSGNWMLPKGDSLNNLWGRMEKLGRFGALAYDPGIVSRMSKFEDFIQRNRAELEPLSLYEIRGRFNKSLGGKIHVYRGMMLSKQQAEAIDQRGIRSQLFQNAGRNDSLGTLLFGERFSGVPEKQRMDRSNFASLATSRLTMNSVPLKLRTNYDPFTSVTTDWQVTHAGAMQKTGKRRIVFGKPGDKFYRYEMNVDVIDTIPMDKTAEYFGDGIQQNELYKTQTLSGPFQKRFFDPGFELLMLSVPRDATLGQPTIYDEAPTWDSERIY